MRRMKYRITQQPPPASGAHNASTFSLWEWDSPAYPAAEPAAIKTRPHRPIIRRYLPTLILIALLVAAIGAYILWRHRPHRHHAHCACHHHGARPLTPWAAIIAIGIRPCSGAVMSLAVAWSWGIAAAGIAMTLTMACGTALTITAIALLCHHGKQHLARRLLRDETRFARLTQTLALAGGIILITLAALLWQTDNSALPSPTNPVGLPR